MATVPDIIHEIQDHEFDDISTTRLLAFINDTYWDICSREPWPFLEEYTAITFNTDGSVSGWPADFGKVLHIRNITDGFTRTLRPERYDYLVNALINKQPTYTGPPQYYYWVNYTIAVWPTPDRSYSGDLKYIKVPIALTNTADDAGTPVFPYQHHRILTLGALAKCYYMTDDSQLGQLFEQQMEARLQHMRADIHMRQYQESDRIYDVMTEGYC